MHIAEDATPSEKVRSRGRGYGGPLPENFEKLDTLRRVFPPSQKLKDIPTKCTFWVDFVGKTLYVVIKKQFSRSTNRNLVRTVMKYLAFPKKCALNTALRGRLSSIYIQIEASQLLYSEDEA
jgi:hypothetical protein